MRVPLYDLAHARAGDKGDVSNISVIVYDPAHWQAVCDQVTEEVVLHLFASMGARSVRRYALPRLHALNFVIDGALAGGVNASLAQDRHGKGLSFHLLGGITVDV